jgi:hypothetical protein
LNDLLRLESLVARAAFRIKELKKFLKSVRVRGVVQESTLALYVYEVFRLELVEMVGQSGIWNFQFFLNLTNDEALGMGGQQQLHDPQARLSAHCREHIGILSHSFYGFLGLGGWHVSIIAEIWCNVKPEIPDLRNLGMLGVMEITLDRQAVTRRGKQLEYFTIAWNTLEGLVAVVAGVLAGSISLVGFGIDSFIEVTSGGVLLWRMSVDADVQKRERRDKLSLRIVGVCFLVLAAYVGYESISDLAGRKAPEHSIPGIILACVSLVVMPLLSRAKNKVGNELGSAAMQADAKQTDFCVYLSAILLLGLVLNAALGWWWADPASALIMVPLIAKEGVEAMNGETCCD